jgi:hypothetical protein
MSLLDSIDRLDSLIVAGAPTPQLRSHLLMIREHVEAMTQAHAKLQEDYAALHANPPMPPVAVPRTERDPCPHCGQPRGRQTGGRAGRPPQFGTIEKYYCDGCGESYEKHKSRPVDDPAGVHCVPSEVNLYPLTTCTLLD